MRCTESLKQPQLYCGVVTIFNSASKFIFTAVFPHEFGNVLGGVKMQSSCVSLSFGFAAVRKAFTRVKEFEGNERFHCASMRSKYWPGCVTCRMNSLYRRAAQRAATELSEFNFLCASWAQAVSPRSGRNQFRKPPAMDVGGSDVPPTFVEVPKIDVSSAAEATNDKTHTTRQGSRRTWIFK